MLVKFMGRRKMSEERPPNSPASEKIMECRSCGHIHSNTRIQCCSERDIHGKLVLSQYGDVSFREWCHREAERLTNKGLSPMVHVEGKNCALYCNMMDFTEINS